MNTFFDSLMWYLNSYFEHLLVYGARTNILWRFLRKKFNIFAKSCILDVLLSSGYFSGSYQPKTKMLEVLVVTFMLEYCVLGLL